MRINTISKNRLFVSPIVQTVDKDGSNMLGFTVYFSDGSFYNVMRSFSAGDHSQVLAELTEEREITLGKADTRECF